MARLLKTNGTGEPEVFELTLGVNLFGRAPENHFPVNHHTVSGRHAELILTADGVLLRDLNSTNGTYVNDALVKQAILQPGQKLRMGDVEFQVDTTDVHIAIPEIERPLPAPPVVLPDGSMLCQRHPGSRVTHHCTHCHSVLCDACVTRLRRKGGKTLKLCKLCSHPVELLVAAKPKKRSFLAKLTATIKLPFLRGKKEPET